MPKDPNLLYIQDDKSRMRRAEVSQCEFCLKTFIRAIKGKQSRRYCSIECSGNGRKRACLLTCSNCKKEYYRVPSKSIGRSLYGVTFCSNECKFAMTTLDRPDALSIPKTWGDNAKSGGVARSRKSNRDKIKIGCIGCGEKRAFLLFIHHIDGNRLNWRSQNMECVCANCHVIRHLKDIDGVWAYQSSALTPRDMITELTNSESSLKDEL